jgi:hypothetical protein
VTAEAVAEDRRAVVLAGADVDADVEVRGAAGTGVAGVGAAVRDTKNLRSKVRGSGSLPGLFSLRQKKTLLYFL